MNSNKESNIEDIKSSCDKCDRIFNKTSYIVGYYNNECKECLEPVCDKCLYALYDQNYCYSCGACLCNACSDEIDECEFCEIITCIICKYGGVQECISCHEYKSSCNNCFMSDVCRDCLKN